MICGDILYVIYASLPFTPIKGKTDGILCGINHVPQIIIIGYGLLDFIIGLYCLIVFVLPLRKILKIEQQTTSNIKLTDQLSLNMIVKKILIYSSTSLISTMIFVLISMKFNQAAGLYTFFTLNLLVFMHSDVYK